MNANELSAGRPEKRKRTEPYYYFKLLTRDEHKVIDALRAEKLREQEQAAFDRQMHEVQADNAILTEEDRDEIWRAWCYEPDQPGTDVAPVTGA